MKAPLVFDGHHYELLNRARADAVVRLLSIISKPMNLKTAVDVGCGVGFFSEVLRLLGLQVTGVDGRQDNAEEAARRVPGVAFQTMNAEDPGLPSIGTFDLAFCFGLLYHLENPLITIRNLRAMTKSVLLAESVIYPGNEPAMFLVDEAVHEDQGLRHIAFYPTEACLIKMFYRVGFTHVYRLTVQPNHPDYLATSKTRRVRTMLAASFNVIDSDLTVIADEPRSDFEPWNSKSDAPPESPRQKLKSLAQRKLTTKFRFIQRQTEES